jgi:hypothetical protein
MVKATAILAAALVAWQTPLTISEQELYRYWRPVDGPAPVTQARIKGFCERSAVQISYVIGSDGFTRNVKIVRSFPSNPFYEQYVRSSVSHARFIPSADNQERNPVQLTETYRFECPARR